MLRSRDALTESQILETSLLQQIDDEDQPRAMLAETAKAVARD